MSGFKLPTSCAICFCFIAVEMTAIWLLPTSHYGQEISPTVGNEIPPPGMYHQVELNPQASALFADIARGLDQVLGAGRTLDSLWAVFGAGAEVVDHGFLLLMTGLPVFVWIKWRYARQAAVGSASLAE